MSAPSTPSRHVQGGVALALTAVQKAAAEVDALEAEKKELLAHLVAVGKAQRQKAALRTDIEGRVADVGVFSDLAPVFAELKQAKGDVTERLKTAARTYEQLVTTHADLRVRRRWPRRPRRRRAAATSSGRPGVVVVVRKGSSSICGRARCGGRTARRRSASESTSLGCRGRRCGC